MSRAVYLEQLRAIHDADMEMRRYEINMDRSHLEEAEHSLAYMVKESGRIPRDTLLSIARRLLFFYFIPRPKVAASFARVALTIPVSTHNLRVQRQRKRKRARLVSAAIEQALPAVLPAVLVTEILSHLFADVTQKRPLA